MRTTEQQIADSYKQIKKNQRNTGHAEDKTINCIASNLL